MDDVEEYLKKLLKGQNPALDSMYGNAQRRVGMSTDRNVRSILQNGAQSGFRGVSANNINDAYRTESDTIGNINDSLMEKTIEGQKFGAEGLMQLDAQKTDFWDVVSGILGSATGGLAGGVGGVLGGRLFKGGGAGAPRY